MAQSKSAKSHRLGVRVLIKDREVETGCINPCRVTFAQFPDPAAALDLGWTPSQIMADCRRMPKEELIPELRQRLLSAGLTAKQVDELYQHSRARIGAVRKMFWEKREAEKMQEEEDNVHDQWAEKEEDHMALGIKLPEEKEEVKAMKFHEALTVGMAPAKALETCEPSRMKDITVEGLQACVDAGLSRGEMAKGFGTTMSTLTWKASQVKFKFPSKRGSSNKDAPAKDAPPDIKPPAPPSDETPGRDRIPATSGAFPAPPDIAAANIEAAAHTPTAENQAEIFGADERRPSIDDETHVDKLLEAIHNSDGPVSRPARRLKVYVAHPLRGTQLQENIASATEVCREYAQRRDIIPFSPLHAFGFLDPMTYDQTHGMAMCFALLESCDELWVHGPWWTSEGCLAEICYAVRRGMAVRFITVHPMVERSA
jgi:hypothetical protein